MEYVLYEFDPSKSDHNTTDEDDDETTPEYISEIFHSF